MVAFSEKHPTCILLYSFDFQNLIAFDLKDRLYLINESLSFEIFFLCLYGK